MGDGGRKAGPKRAVKERDGGREERFKRAVEQGDVAGVRALVEAGGLGDLVNRPLFWFGGRALNVAVGNHRSPELVDVLLDAGADPDLRSDWENGPYAPLHAALGGNGPIHLELAEHLVARGATIDLHSAAALGRTDLLASMLDAAPERVTERGPDGASPLHLAADPEIAAFLLERGADVHQRCTDHNSTAAMWAVEEREDVTAYLVTRGAEPDLFMAAVLDDVDLAARVLAADPASARSRTGRGRFGDPPGGNIYIWRLGFVPTPLAVAEKRGHESVRRFLVENSPPDVLLLDAARRGDVTGAERLLAAHSGLVEHLAEADVSILLRTVPPLIERFVAHGADPDAFDGPMGATPLHDAMWHGDLARVAALLDAGADADLRDRRYGGTPLGWGLHGGQDAAVALLRERRPDPVR